MIPEDSGLKRRRFLFRLRVGAVLLMFVVDFVFLVFATRSLSNSFNTLELLIAEGAGMLLLGAVAYALVRKRSESMEPPPADRNYWNLAVVACFALTVAGISQSTWYLNTIAMVGIGACVALFALSILSGADRSTSVQLTLIFAVAILIKSSVYFTNLAPWVGDGRAHLDSLANTLAFGHTTLNLADYYFYPGYYFLNTLVLAIGGTPYVLIPVQLFAEICTSSLIAFLIGRRVAGARAGLLAGLLVAVTFGTNISWQPNQVAVIYPMMLLYMIISHESVVGSRKLAGLSWGFFGASLLTYPVAALMAVIVGLGEFVWRFRFGRIFTFAIGAAVSLAAYVLFVSTFLFGDVILSVFGVGTGSVQLPVISSPPGQVGLHYLLQYTSNFLVFLVPLSFASVILILYVVTPPVRERFVLVAAMVAVPSLAVGQLLLPGRVTNWTEILYLYPFTSTVGALGALFLVKRAPSRRAAAVLASVLIAVVAVTAVIGYSPSQALYKSETPFYPFYLSPAVYSSSWIPAVLPNSIYVTSDADTITQMFPLVAISSRNITAGTDIGNATAVSCGRSSSAVILDLPELSRIYAPSGGALYAALGGLLANDSGAIRFADSLGVVSYVCPSH